MNRVITLLVGFSVCGNVLSQRLQQEQAKEEIKMVVNSIMRHHPDPFHECSKSAFYEEVDRLMERGEVSISRQYFDLARLASLITDTHTQLYPTAETPGFDSTFPLRFKLFPDGLYIIAGDEYYKGLIGAKVLSIAGSDAMELLDSLSFYSPADNLPRKRVYAEMFFYLPEMYEVFNLKSSDGRIEMVVNRQGKDERIVLDKTWDRGLPNFSWDMLNPFIPEGLITLHQKFNKRPPMFLQNMNRKYWYGFLDDNEEYFYIQINQSGEEEKYHSLKFHLDWTKELLASKAEVVIVDLRNNPGGQTNIGSGITKFLESYYYAYPESKLRGVAILTGYDTVSAGVILAAEIENAVWPIFIGEPSGSSPNMYLEDKKMILPYSKLRFSVSQTEYISVKDKDPRNYIAPDIPISISFEDYLNGLDPVIEAAKKINKDVHNQIYENAEFNAIWKRDSQSNAIKR